MVGNNINYVRSLDIKIVLSTLCINVNHVFFENSFSQNRQTTRSFVKFRSEQ